MKCLAKNKKQKLKNIPQQKKPNIKKSKLIYSNLKQTN